jgi:glycosyltransferase involved in cell wall biosynthesis
VTVVIPTHNRQELLDMTLAAVLAQAGVDLEVVVVDDGSDVEVVTPDDPRVRAVRHTTPRGVAAARNRGIAEARRRWIAFTDDDDIWAPDKLALQLAALAENPGFRWSVGGSVQVDDALAIFDSNHPPMHSDVAHRLLVSNPIPGGASGVVADAQLVREVGGFDESLSMCADYDLWIRLALASPLAAVDRPLLAYRVHEGGMSRSLENIRTELEIIDAKYAAERTMRGLVVADAINLWIGDRHQRSGRRLAAARAYLRSSHTIGRPRSLGRGLEAIVWPGAFHHRDERRSRAVPAGWRSEVEVWLGPIRAGEERSMRAFDPGAGTSSTPVRPGSGRPPTEVQAG